MRLSGESARVPRDDGAAALLFRHRLDSRAFEGFAVGDSPVDEAEAYVVQESLHEKLIAAGWGDLAGYKIGCTTSVMQGYLNISQPCAGGLFANCIQATPGVIDLDRYVRVGVECEIAVRIGADLPVSRSPFDISDVAAAVESVMAAIEIVDDRYVSSPSLSAPELIADDFFGAGCILGSESTGCDVSRLGQIDARLLVDGIEVGSGHGAEILGDPLRALVWLANTLADRGRGLRSADVVLLGSLVRTHWIQGEDRLIAVENSDLGVVEARVVA